MTLNTQLDISKSQTSKSSIIKLTCRIFAVLFSFCVLFSLRSSFFICLVSCLHLFTLLRIYNTPLESGARNVRKKINLDFSRSYKEVNKNCTGASHAPFRPC